MDPVKLTAVAKCPETRNVNKLQSFIGFSNFYKCFIDNILLIVQPPHNLGKESIQVVLIKMCNKVFEPLK